MAARSVRVLLISAVVISVTGILATWITSFQDSEIRIKSSINSFTVRSNPTQTEMTTLASASDVAEGVSNTLKPQIITKILGTASVNMMFGSSVESTASSVAITEPSQQTTAETAAVSAAGAVRSTAGETIVSSETTENVKARTLPGTRKSEIQETAQITATACTQMQVADEETLTNTAQITPESERISESDIIHTQKSQAEISITSKQESRTTATANIRSVTPILEPLTVRTTNFIAKEITPENEATATTSPDITFRTEAVMTETKADLTEEKLAPTTAVIKRPKTAGTGPSEVETSEKTTVRPQTSPQSLKTSSGPSINEATGISLLTMIQTATGKQGKTVGGKAGKGTTIQSIVKDLTTISSKRKTAKVFEKLTTRSHKSDSPCTGKCQTKSTTKTASGQDKKPMSQKTLYSAIIMGSILVVCGLLALVVFIKDFTGPD